MLHSYTIHMNLQQWESNDYHLDNLLSFYLIVLPFGFSSFC